MQQLAESQKEFQLRTAQTLEAMQNDVYLAGEVSNYSLTEMKSQIEQNDQNHLNQLSKLQSQNQLFSQSLNAVLTTVVDMLSVQHRYCITIAYGSHRYCLQEISAVNGQRIE